MDIEALNAYGENVLSESRELTRELLEVIRDRRAEMLERRQPAFVDNIITQSVTHILGVQLAWLSSLANDTPADKLPELMHNIEEQVALGVREIMNKFLPEGTTTVVAEIPRKEEQEDGE